LFCFFFQLLETDLENNINKDDKIGLCGKRIPFSMHQAAKQEREIMTTWWSKHSFLIQLFGLALCSQSRSCPEVTA